MISSTPGTTMRLYNYLLAVGLVLAYVCIAPPSGLAQTTCTVAGVITTTTWQPADCAIYIATRDVVVPAGVTLLIQPGTRVQFAQNTRLQVFGTLVGRGTAASPILLTSTSTARNPGDWRGVTFEDSAADAAFDSSGTYTGGSILQYATIQYAGGESDFFNGAVLVYGSAPYLDHNTIEMSGSYGIRLQNTPPLRVTNNTASDSLRGGMRASVSGGTTSYRISGNTMHDNGEAGMAIIGLPGFPRISSLTLDSNTVNGNVGGGIIVGSGTYTLTNNIIMENRSGGRGAGLSLTAAFVTATGNTVAGNIANEGAGIVVQSSTVTLSGNDIYANSDRCGGGRGRSLYNANTASESPVDARSNYWGTTDISTIAGYIWDKADDSRLSTVDATSPLSAPTTALVTAVNYQCVFVPFSLK